MTILATGACSGAAMRNSAALDRERELQRRRGLSATRGGTTSNTMRALKAAEEARAREAWLASPERAAQRLARRQAAQASRVSANQHSPGTSQQEASAATSQQESSAAALIPRLDALLSEQATLTQIMKGFDLQLQAGADGESLLCSPSFQAALARLGAAQEQQRELLSVARERIVRDYPTLLEASRSLLELLSAVAARASGEPQQDVATLAQTHGGQGGGERAGAQSHHPRRWGGTRLRLPFRRQGDPIYRSLPVECTECGAGTECVECAGSAPSTAPST